LQKLEASLIYKAEYYDKKLSQIAEIVEKKPKNKAMNEESKVPETPSILDTLKK
jgi:hypothetical protein